MEFQNFLEQKNKLYSTTSKTERFFDVFFSVVFYILTIFFVLYFCFKIVFIQARVVGISMEPTFNSDLVATQVYDEGYYENSIYKDYIYANRFDKGTNGDIVIVDIDNQLVVKRIIASAGQTLLLKKGQDGYYYYYVDGKMIDEDYIYSREDMNLSYYLAFSSTPIESKQVDGDMSTTIVVPQGCVFVLGDNRFTQYSSGVIASKDSRFYGAVSKEKIVGKVSFYHAYNKTLLGYLFENIFSIFWLNP